ELLRLLRFEIHVDRHVIAQKEAAVVEGLVPVDSVVLAIDDGRQREAGALVAPGIFAEAAELDRDGDVLGHATHRQIASYVIHVLFLRRDDARALERELRTASG